MCPITSRPKGYPFEVVLPERLPISGVVLADQVKSFDWRLRRAEKAARAGEVFLSEVRAKLAVLLGL